MGDVRFASTYARVRDASDQASEIHALDDAEVIAALAGASRENDPYLANVLATEALNRSRRAQAIFSHLGEGILTLDDERRILSINACAAEMLGIEGHDVRGVAFDRIVHGHEDPGCSFVEQVRAASESVRSDETFQRSDGTRFPISCTVSPVFDDNHRQGTIVIFRDITERLEAQRRLAESESRYRSMFDFNPESVFYTDREGRFTDGNPAAEHLTGYTVQEVIGRHFREMIHPDDGPLVLHHHLRVLEGEPQTFRCRAIRKDGTIAHLEVKTIPAFVGGTIEGVFGIAVDVTAQVRQAAIRARRESRHRAMDNALIQLSRARWLADGDAAAAIADITRIGRNMLNVPHCSVWTLDDDGHSLRTQRRTPRAAIPLQEAQSLAAALANERAIHTGAAASDPRTKPFCRALSPPPKSMLIAPIRGRPDLVGALTFASRSDRTWRRADVEFASHLACLLGRLPLPRGAPDAPREPGEEGE